MPTRCRIARTDFYKNMSSPTDRQIADLALALNISSILQPQRVGNIYGALKFPSRGQDPAKKKTHKNVSFVNLGASLHSSQDAWCFRAKKLAESAIPFFNFFPSLGCVCGLHVPPPTHRGNTVADPRHAGHILLQGEPASRVGAGVGRSGPEHALGPPSRLPQVASDARWAGGRMPCELCVCVDVDSPSHQGETCTTLVQCNFLCNVVTPEEVITGDFLDTFLLYPNPPPAVLALIFIGR